MPEIVFCCACGRLIPQADIESKAAAKASAGLLCRKCAEAALAPTGRIAAPVAGGIECGTRPRTTSRRAGGGNVKSESSTSTVAIRPRKPMPMEAKIAAVFAAIVVGSLLAGVIVAGKSRRQPQEKSGKTGVSAKPEMPPATVKSAHETNRTPPAGGDPFSTPRVILPINDLEWEKEAAEALRKADVFAENNRSRPADCLPGYEAVCRDYPGSKAGLDAEMRILKLKAIIDMENRKLKDDKMESPQGSRSKGDSTREVETK